jgi:hypothetical protein
MNTTNDTTRQHQFVWPLPGTKLPHAHLTWAEWVARQAATNSREQSAALAVPALTLSADQCSVRYLDVDATVHFVWPLPATQLPNAHLTWAEWLDVQANGAAIHHAEHAACQHAA